MARSTDKKEYCDVAERILIGNIRQILEYRPTDKKLLCGAKDNTNIPCSRTTCAAFMYTYKEIVKKLNKKKGM